MLKNATKAVAFGALALAVGAGAFWYLHLDPEAEQAQTAAAQESPAAIAVEAAEVEVDEVVDAMTVTGNLRSDESAHIATEIEGRVHGVHFTEGQAVEQGALLFTLDDTVYRAELATAEANLQLSERNNERAIELLQRNAGTVRARDEAEAQLAIDRAERRPGARPPRQDQDHGTLRRRRRPARDQRRQLRRAGPGPRQSRGHRADQGRLPGARARPVGRRGRAGDRGHGRRLARQDASRARSTPSTRRSTRRAAASRSAPPSTTRSACCAPACSPRCG